MLAGAGAVAAQNSQLLWNQVRSRVLHVQMPFLRCGALPLHRQRSYSLSPALQHEDSAVYTSAGLSRHSGASPTFRSVSTRKTFSNPRTLRDAS